jgi:uncharacterized protein YciI
LFYELVDGFADKRAPWRGDHLVRIAEARDRGDLLMAGPLSEPLDTAILVFADKPGVAEEFARTDPYVTNGVVKSWHVRKWMTVVGPGATLPVPA